MVRANLPRHIPQYMPSKTYLGQGPHHLFQQTKLLGVMHMLCCQAFQRLSCEEWKYTKRMIGCSFPEQRLSHTMPKIEHDQIVFFTCIVKFTYNWATLLRNGDFNAFRTWKPQNKMIPFIRLILPLQCQPFSGLKT